MSVMDEVVPLGDTSAPPRVSVIMPVRDVGHWVGQTIESIRGQSLTSWELIAVDDGSQDDTVAQLVDAAALDPRIRLVLNPGSGGADARNHAVTLARGEFLAFADGDDVVPRDAYRNLIAQADASGAEMVVGNYVVIEPQHLATRDETTPLYSRVRSGLTIVDEPAVLRDRVCWNRIIRRDAWQQLDLAFASSRRSNDIAVMTQAYCALRFDMIPTPVYAYRRRVGPTSMTAAKHRPDSLREHFLQEWACARAVERVDVSEVTEYYYRQILSLDLWAHGVAALSSPDPAYDDARHLLVSLVARAPKASRLSLEPRRRLAYHLAERRLWDAAALVVGDLAGPDLARRLAEIDGAGLFRSVFTLEPTLQDGLVELLERATLKPLRETPYDFSDDEVLQMYRIGVGLCRAGDLDGFLAVHDRRLLQAELRHAAPIRAWATTPPATPRPPSTERRLRAVLRTHRTKGRVAALAEAYRAAQYLRSRQIVEIAQRLDRDEADRIVGLVRKKFRRC